MFFTHWKFINSPEKTHHTPKPKNARLITNTLIRTSPSFSTSHENGWWSHKLQPRHPPMSETGKRPVAQRCFKEITQFAVSIETAPVLNWSTSVSGGSGGAGRPSEPPPRDDYETDRNLRIYRLCVCVCRWGGWGNPISRSTMSQLRVLSDSGDFSKVSCCGFCIVVEGWVGIVFFLFLFGVDVCGVWL